MKDTPAGEYKRGLVGQAGLTDLLPAVAGQSLSPIFPTGMGRISAMGAGGAAFLSSHPALAAMLPLTSPRIMGEAFYGAGKGAALGGKGLQAVQQALQQKFGPGSFQGLTPTQLNALAPLVMTNANQLGQ